MKKEINAYFFVSTGANSVVSRKSSFYDTHKYDIGRNAAYNLIRFAEKTIWSAENWDDLKATESQIVALAKGASMNFIINEDALTGQKYLAVLY